MNKLNKLVNTAFPDMSDEWLAEEFQKKLKKVFKTKKEKSEKSAVDSDKPKQHTPYIQFCMSERPEVKKDYPTMSAKEITAKLGEKWNRYKIEKPEILEEKYGYVAKV